MREQPETLEALQTAIRTLPRIRVVGARTKSTTAGDQNVLSMVMLRGQLEYTAAECVFTAPAGTPLREINAALQAHGQYLPFDPPFVDEGATIGGTVASGLSGPRRYRYGGVRDFVIGIRLVDGEGRVIRSGGKVVKNAAGFLLHHGVVGSCGRFGVITEVTCKVFPSPEARRTLSIACGSVETAFSIARRIESLRVDCEAVDFDEQGHLHVTIAGREVALDARAARLTAVISNLTEPVVLSPTASDVERTATAHAPGTACVKVPGLMNSWRQLRTHVTSAHFMCAGAVAWITTSDVEALGHVLAQEGLVGQVFRGSRAGDRIGALVPNEFEERIRRVLDPRDKFSAASHPSH